MHPQRGLRYAWPSGLEFMLALHVHEQSSLSARRQHTEFAVWAKGEAEVVLMSQFVLTSGPLLSGQKEWVKNIRIQWDGNEPWRFDQSGETKPACGTTGTPLFCQNRRGLGLATVRGSGPLSGMLQRHLKHRFTFYVGPLTTPKGSIVYCNDVPPCFFRDPEK